MIGAAVALALALVVAPGPPRYRLRPSGDRARMRIPVGPLLMVSLGALAVVAPLGVTMAAAIVVATAQARRRRDVRRRRRAEEAVALQGALETLVGELRVGAHPVAAFATAAGEVEGLVAASMRRVAATARMGADVAAGLRSIARRSSLPAYWDRLAVCWQLAHDHGLAIATLMATAQRDIVARERFSAQVTAGMAGARTTAVILAALPVLGIGLGQLIGADPIRFLISPGAGQWLLVIGVALSCTGLAWSDVITGRVTK